MGLIDITVGNNNGTFCGGAEIKIMKKFKSYDEAEGYVNKLKICIENYLLTLEK